MDYRIAISRISQEICLIEDSNWHESTKQRHISWLNSLRQKAKKGDWVKKIIWDKDGGHPEHALGFVQYSLRPYRQGYGCDGTTDKNIHLIASVMTQREDWDYVDLYQKAYGDRDDVSWVADWVNDLQHNPSLQNETRIPTANSTKTWAMTLNDLYQINNRSLEAVLEELVFAKYPEAKKYLSL